MISHTFPCAPTDEEWEACPGQPCALLLTPPPTHNTGTNRIALPAARRPYREQSQQHDLGRMDHVCRHCGALHWLLERSTGNGSSNAHPLFTMCCNRGDIELPPMAPPPDQLSNFNSRRSHRKLIGSVSTSVNTTQPSHSHRLVSRWTAASMRWTSDIPYPW